MKIKNQKIYTSSSLILPNLAFVSFFMLGIDEALSGDFFRTRFGELAPAVFNCLFVTFFSEAHRNKFKSFLLLIDKPWLSVVFFSDDLTFISF